jgi:hypothetical protein
MTLVCSVVSSGRTGARQLAAWGLASGLLLAAPVSQAEPTAADAERAERLFDDGRAAMAEQSFDFACAAFAESQRLDPAAGTLVNFGACLEAQGKIVEALQAYRSSLASAAPGIDPDRERFVEARIAALEPRVCRVIISMVDPPAGVHVQLDTTVLEASRWNTPVATDRGGHGVQVSAPGYRAWSEAFTLDSDGAVRRVEVPTLERDSPSSARPASQLVSAVKPAPSGGTRRVELFIASGVALAGVATTAYFGALAASAWDERQRHCPAHRCDDAAVAASNRAATFARVADVAAAVTGAGLVGGLYIVLSSPLGKSPFRSGLVVNGQPRGMQVRWNGEF